MLDHMKRILAGQFEAGLCMLDDCLRACPDEYWDGVIGKYPFWHVAYHTLCFVDLYLSPGEAAYASRDAFHPAGMKEFSEEYPSRRFSRAELLAYAAVCRTKIAEVLAADTAAALEADCGFHWLPISRGELHLYNIRHLQHHTGQLSAFLRRASVETRWVKSGWRSAAGPAT